MKDKVVIVTGGSRGIGAGITEAFYEKGASVVVNYRNNKEAALALKNRLDAKDENFLLIGADISTFEGRQRLVSETIEHFGRIDVLVNNAGIAAKKRFLKGTEEEFESIIDTNLKAPIFLAQACAKTMIDNSICGSIINISSVSATIANAPTSYCASKAGLQMASKTMALALAQHKIRVNTVTPGTIKSDMNRWFWQDNPDVWNKLTEKMPLQRGGEPKELASAVVYLASDESSFITGSDILVDGGWSLTPNW
jgi:NAD(P)-dependent dehydrogenase (short-subunit alcohol dehydrogenase family)